LPEALSDAGAPGKRVSQPLIEAGGALLLSPEGEGIVKHTPSQARMIVRVQPAKKVVGSFVEVNAAVFADGEVRGPDNMQIAEQLRLQLEEQQNLLKEVSRRVAAGEQLIYFRIALHTLRIMSAGRSIFGLSTYPKV
jgi:hypothetical protein